MTTILAAAAVVLFAILIGIVVFFFFVYQREELENKKDEIKAQPGPYRPYTDVPSLHPDSCVQETPFSYKFKPTAIISKEIQDRIEQESNEVIKILYDQIDTVLEELNIRDEMIYKSENRIEKLEKLVRHLYLERNEDMNEIENSVIDPYYKNKFENDKQLDTNEDNIE